MTNLTVKEHNVQTGEITERPMTADELKAYNAELIAEQALQEKKAALQATKEAAEAKLAALGLTSDDLKALGL
jgi:hypothetical protein